MRSAGGGVSWKNDQLWDAPSSPCISLNSSANSRPPLTEGRNRANRARDAAQSTPAKPGS